VGGGRGDGWQVDPAASWHTLPELLFVEHGLYVIIFAILQPCVGLSAAGRWSFLLLDLCVLHILSALQAS
jgi:hypothetical protein